MYGENIVYDGNNKDDGLNRSDFAEVRYTALLLVAIAQYGNKQTYITTVNEDRTRKEREINIDN